MDQLRFIVDVNVGKLAKWLRVLGYDAAFVNPISDGELVRRALEEGRVVLTKDRGIAVRRLASEGRLQVLLVPGDRVQDQLHFVITSLGLQGSRLFTRCLQCNEPLEKVERDSVQDEVPAYVFATQDRYRRCPWCRKVYWPGSHWERMMEQLKGLTSGAPQAQDGPKQAWNLR